MALVKCKECGEKVSSTAMACPNCGAKPPKKTSIVTWFLAGLIAFGVYSVWNSQSSMTPEQRQEQAERIEAKREAAAQVDAEEEAQEAAQKVEDQRKGFHCLSKWDGSHPEVKSHVADRMNDPDSFDHVDTRITPVDSNGRHQLVMTYRGANALGGVQVAEASAYVDNETCNATITLVE